MIKPHEGRVKLKHDFGPTHEWLFQKVEISLQTAKGTRFTSRSALVRYGEHAGKEVIRFFQHGIEFVRAYRCCWGHYYHCNRTRIGCIVRPLIPSFKRLTGVHND